MKFLGRTFGNRIEEKKVPTAKIVKSQFLKERPLKVTFERLIQYHDQTPQIQIAISSYSELISGTEMIISTEDTAAKELIDEWIRHNQFYDKFEALVTTLLICGNALLEKLDEKNIEDVEEVDMATIMSKKRDENGELMWYEQRQQQGQMVKLGEGNLDKFIEFNLTHYSKQPWGISLFNSLAVPRVTGFRVTPPLVEAMWGLEDAAVAILQNNAFPITTITYPGANDEYLEKEAERWRRYKPGDKRVQKIAPKIEFFESSQSASRYQILIEHIEKVFELGTQFPHDIMTGDFTSRASSETTETIVMKKVRGFQRYLANKLKSELFDVLLDQNGFNAEEVDLEVSFTAQNVVELNPDQVSKMCTDGIMTKNECRNWYRVNAGIELEDDKEIEDEQELQKVQAENPQQQQMDDLEKKIEKLTIHKKHNDSVRELSDKMERKFELIKEALANNKEELAQKRIRALEKIIEKAENIG